jgi:hypothetical protein
VAGRLEKVFGVRGGPAFVTPARAAFLPTPMKSQFLLALAFIHCAAFAVEPIAKGQRVATCGHSFHVWAVPMLVDLAGKAGIQGHEVAGLSSIGGSMVVKHWEVPAEKSQVKQALAAGRADVLTLSPIWLPDAGIENFVRLGLEKNPDLRITVQEFWLPNDEYNPVYPLDTRKKVDHNATDLAALRQHQDRYRQDLGNHLRDLNRQLGKQAVVLVPVGAATVALREQIAAGKIRALKVPWRLFTDDWGHPTSPLKVLAAYCHYAVIYRRSPVGLPMPEEFEKNQEFKVPTLNRLLQELAWEACVNEPLAGLRAEPVGK